MTYQQLGFLCGIIKDNIPKKIVEVGIASGGTTAVILNTIKLLGSRTKVISVDIADQFYRDPTKKTGFMADEFQKKYAGGVDWAKKTGSILPEVIEDIGADIDLLILDTMHIMPGEILDFLTAFPYLSSNAIVIIHDTALHHIGRNKDAYATQMLLNTVVADRMEPLECEEVYGYPNIGAFKINQDTRKYILNVFGSLRMTWKYLIGKDDLASYYRIYEKLYGKDYADILKQAYKMNSATLNRYFENRKRQTEEIIDFFGIISKNEKIILYGYGNYGKKIEDILKRNGHDLYMVIVSDGVEISDNTEKIKHVSEGLKEIKEGIVIVAVSERYHLEIEATLKQKGIKNYYLPTNELLTFFDTWSAE